MSEKTARSCDIQAIRYDPGNIGCEMHISRAPVAEQWFTEKSTVHHYPITTRLRMLRCLSLQSAFLARDGAVLK